MFIRWFVFTTNFIRKAHRIIVLKVSSSTVNHKMSFWTLYKQNMWTNTFHDSVFGPISWGYTFRKSVFKTVGQVNQQGHLFILFVLSWLFRSLEFCLFKLDNLTLVSSKLRAQVNSSEQATLELLERTQNRETNLTGISSGSFIYYDNFVAISSAQMCFLTHCLSGCRNCAERWCPQTGSLPSP